MCLLLSPSELAVSHVLRKAALAILARLADRHASNLAPDL